MSRFDYSQMQRGLRALARDSGRSKLALTRMAAKGFVKDVISISPPASKGITGQAAKKRGEAGIVADVAKLLIPAQNPTGANAKARGELWQFHKAHFRGGRVRIADAERAVARPQDIAWLVRTLQKLVGWLAAGWNAGAVKLGVTVPAWVKRHGSRFGEHEITVTATRVRIELSNTVGFVGDVKAYDRRVQAAINYQGKKMQRQSDALLKKRLKVAGL